MKYVLLAIPETDYYRMMNDIQPITADGERIELDAKISNSKESRDIKLQWWDMKTTLTYVGKIREEGEEAVFELEFNGEVNIES